MSQEIISVASLNTLHLEAIRSGNALGEMRAADIAMFQEVSSHVEDKFEAALDETGFDLVGIDGRVGLAIAVRRSSSINYKEESAAVRLLQPLSVHERALAAMHIKAENDFSHRGMLAAKFITAAGAEFTAVTVHPAAPINWIRRRRQIGMVGVELAKPDYAGRLIVGGDWNHWPRPEPADTQMWQSTGLQPLDLDSIPTWQAKGFEQKLHTMCLAIMRGRTVNRFTAQLDSILYRDLAPIGGSVKKASGSDHAIVFGLLAVDN